MHLSIVGMDSVSMLLRVIDAIAKRGICVTEIATKSADQIMEIRIRGNPISHHGLQVLVEHLRAIVEVSEVRPYVEAE